MYVVSPLSATTAPNDRAASRAHSSGAFSTSPRAQRSIVPISPACGVRTARPRRCANVSARSAKDASAAASTTAGTSIFHATVEISSAAAARSTSPGPITSASAAFACSTIVAAAPREIAPERVSSSATTSDSGTAQPTAVATDAHVPICSLPAPARSAAVAQRIAAPGICGAPATTKIRPRSSFPPPFAAGSGHPRNSSSSIRKSATRCSIVHALKHPGPVRARTV